MCQPRKWWWGLLPLIALWAMSLYVLTPQIESELTHRVKTALGSEMPWARTAIEGRDIIIEGSAPSEEAKHKAMMAAVETDGVRLAVNTAGLMPEVKPFAWDARRDGGKVTLAGYVAGDGSRKKVVDEARKVIPGAEVVDQMKDARGAPASSLSMMTTALGTLAKLKSGSVALVDNKLAIKGIAPDSATASAISAAAKSLPQPLQVVSVDVTAQPQPATAATTTAPPAAPTPKAAALPVERPYTWKATKDGDGVALSGFVPSEAARAQVVTAARKAAGTGKVVDQMKPATGLPAAVDFNAAVGFAATQLGQLRTGTAKLSDAALTIEGEALDAAGYRAIMSAVAGTVPGGIKAEAANLTPPRVTQYTWSAKRDAKTLTLGGYFPDDGTQTAMLQGVAQRFSGIKLDDRTSIASGAPDGFSAALGMGLDQLSRLEQGEASIAAGKLTISGIAPTDSIANDVKAALAKLVGGMPAVAKVTVAVAKPAAPPPPLPPVAVVSPPPSPPIAMATPQPAVPAAPLTPAPTAVAKPAPPVTVPLAPVGIAPPAPAPAATVVAPAPSTMAPPIAKPQVAAPADQSTAPAIATAAPKASPAAATTCGADFVSAAKSGSIGFASSQAAVLQPSSRVIAKVAAVMKRCPTLRIEVGGHTDATGSVALNERLSRDRAAAVVAVLAKRGIAADRMKSTGYAAMKPIADNTTRAGKARNRRIEFTVVE